MIETIDYRVREMATRPDRFEIHTRPGANTSAPVGLSSGWSLYDRGLTATQVGVAITEDLRFRKANP